MRLSHWKIIKSLINLSKTTNTTYYIMSLEKANEMVKFLKNLNEERTKAGELPGFKSREVYEYGKSYGLTCHEIAVTFLLKKRAISWGRYLPEEISEEKILAAPKRKRKVANLGSVSMDDVVAAAQASVKPRPPVNKTDRLTMIKEIVLRKEAEEMADTAAEEFTTKENKSFDKGDSPEETCYKYSQMSYTQEDVEEELALMGTYI